MMTKSFQSTSLALALGALAGLALAQDPIDPDPVPGSKADCTFTSTGFCGNANTHCPSSLHCHTGGVHGHDGYYDADGDGCGCKP